MTLLEIFLLPLYILLFHLHFRSRRKKLNGDILKKYHKQAFWLKLFSTILFVLYYTYLTSGDTRDLFYSEGRNYFHLLLDDSSNWRYLFENGKSFDERLVALPGNYGYYLDAGNYFVIKITALLCFITFGQYTLISLFFGLFAFSGLWRLFMFFYERKPELHKEFAIAILFFPSVVFWSSGLLKDPLSIGALGWFTYSLSQWTRGKNLLKSTIMIILSAYIIIIVKMYILLAYAPFLALFLFLDKLKKIKSVFIKAFIAMSIVTGIGFAFSMTYDSYQDEMGDYAIENLTSTISTISEILSEREAERGAESNFDIGGTFDGSLGGLVKLAPLAVTATFYRPFIWETRKISQLMAAVESMILMFFTLKLLLKAGPFRLLKYIASDSMITFSILFAIVFGVFVGISTPNFGSLVRYKIPCMPFYTIALFLLRQKVFEAEKKKQELKSIAPIAVPTTVLQ